MRAGFVVHVGAALSVLHAEPMRRGLRARMNSTLFSDGGGAGERRERSGKGLTAIGRLRAAAASRSMRIGVVPLPSASATFNCTSFCLSPEIGLCMLPKKIGEKDEMNYVA
ncbi:hypothetical protein C2S52_013361 [Perilla frutescens var. hirtella]|nr:hypothetical protein C2S51_015664 [Perilla frutescens var. frutescens]KAH6775800.1 hypothetical protein C2S52_013361 [Perilla frutescens var. hirtella]